MKTLTLAALTAATLALPAQAQTVYSNNFDGENGGNSALNYNGFNGLTVSNGTVDIIRSGDFGIQCRDGAGSCVDLDGTTNQAGVLSSTNSYAFNAGDLVTLNFSVSGNQRGFGPDNVDISFNFGQATSGTSGFTNSVSGGTFPLGFFTAQNAITLSGIGLDSNYPWDDVSYYFRAANAGTLTFSFANAGGDNVGVVLDNVSLSVAAVPEPATWALMILGMGAIGGAMRRRGAAKVHFAA